jgi:hypothetical protein
MTTNEYYQLTAERLADNYYCEVWVEKGCGVNAAEARAVANEYYYIYVKMMNAFGWRAYTDESQTTIIDTMELADSLGDENGKLTILLLDIKDGYVNNTSSYLAGYFHMINFFDDKTADELGVKSNNCDMIFMDTYPLEVGSEGFYSTLAHEMQHMMNFVTAFAFRWGKNEKGEDVYFPMDTWVDEGLSSAAEWVYSDKPDQNRVKWYNDDRTGLIAQGDNFFLWGNYEKAVPDSILNDYATVNIFFQWLRLVPGEGNSRIYSNIVLSDYPDYRAILDLNDPKNPLKWPSLMEKWHAANFINHASNDYGYKNDPVLKTIKANYLDTSGKPTPGKIGLYSGEAVYSYSSAGMTVPAANDVIKYSGLGATAPSSFNVPAKGALLSYNINTAYDGPLTDVTVTGVKPPSPPIANIQTAGSRSVSDFGPQRIGMGDIRGRREYDRNLLSAAQGASRSAGGRPFKLILIKEPYNE